MSMAHEDERHRARVEALREAVMELHKGRTVDEVKKEFKELIKDVSLQEISAMEQALIDQGIPVEEVQRLCDVHASVFRDALEMHPEPKADPGHPLHTFLKENRAIEALIADEIEPALAKFESGADNAMDLLGKINLLFDIDKHYKRKEEVYFPILEKYGVIGPTQVMWGVDDEIRAALKSVHAKLLSFDGRERPQTSSKVKELLQAVKDMIYKEEKILIPITEEHFTTDEWSDIHLASEEIGYCLVEPDAGWVPSRTEDSEEEVGVKRGIIRLPTGTFSVDQLELILNTLPVDITFIDENDEVRYFSDSAERIFTRPRTIIGRNVRNCHPPASVHVVEEIVNSFRQGTRDVAEFWIRMGDKYVYIRYFAVRDREGAYRGTLEVSQEISGIKALEGERRLLDD
jgi:PAS domain S-box-containing protein